MKLRKTLDIAPPNTKLFNNIIYLLTTDLFRLEYSHIFLKLKNPTNIFKT